MIKVSKQFARPLSLFRFRPFDTDTEKGRSKERLRRAALTTMATGAARAIALLTSLVSVPLTYRYLGAERYGIWMVLISIIAAMSFADLGIGTGLMNAVSDAYGKDDRSLAKEHVSSALVLMLCIASLLAVIGAVGYPFVPWLRVFNVKSQGVAEEGARAFLVLYASFVINIPLGVITRAQAGLQKGYASQIVSACGNILSLGGMLLVISLRASLVWLVFVSVIAGILATVFNGWILFRECPWLLPSVHAYRARSASKIFTLGLMFFVLQCAYSLSFTSDNIVIAQILGTAAVAAYAVPQKLFSSVSLVVSMAISPLWPAYGEAISRGDVAWVRRVFFNSIWLVLVISVPICTLLALAGPWILRVVVGTSLHVPMSLIATLALWGVVYSGSFPLYMLLNGSGVVRTQATVSVIASSSNLVFSIYLTQRLGTIGVCLGSIITQLVITLPIQIMLIKNFFKGLAKTKARLQPWESLSTAREEGIL